MIPTSVRKVGPNHYHEIHDGETMFRHRVRVNGQVSDWVPYISPAVLHTNAGTFICVTDAYAGSAEFGDPSVMYKICKIDQEGVK